MVCYYEAVKFFKVSDTQPVVEYLVAKISKPLSDNKKVLWLVPGGSSIEIAAAVSKKLQRQDLRNLTITLTDERYGPIDHPDSNWRQLKEAGFSVPDAKQLPVLVGLDRQASTEHFSQNLRSELANVDYRLGFFGIGADGHTAGILPKSPATSTNKFTIDYDAGSFQRITITPTTIARLDEAVVYAVGQQKWPVLDTLEEELSVNDQPAQCLKQVSVLSIFNDHKGETP